MTDDVDYFAVYSPTTERTYLVDVDDASSGKMQLRFEPAANDQQVGVNWHEEYALETVLETWKQGEAPSPGLEPGTTSSLR